jgi:hypothetical protein
MYWNVLTTTCVPGQRQPSSSPALKLSKFNLAWASLTVPPTSPPSS